MNVFAPTRLIQADTRNRASDTTTTLTLPLAKPIRHVSSTSRRITVPTYLEETYNWAYINPRNVQLLDREIVVKTILWGQHRRLQQAALAEIEPGQSVLQPACVYGDFSPNLARHLGTGGALDVIDVAPVQVANCQRKINNYPQASVRQGDASQHQNRLYDAVCCYFLMHELPDSYKAKVASTLLESIRPGGKVIFVDYHKPHWAHPLKLITRLVFDTLEPFAKSLWFHEIADYADNGGRFTWKKQTYFGGLYQRVVAQAEGGA